MTTHTVSLTSEAKRIYRHAVERAAFRQVFDPRSIVARDQKDANWVFAMEALASKCIEVDTVEGMRWSILPDERIAVLRELHSEARLETLAHEELHSGDRLGVWLANLVLKKNVVVDQLDSKDLEILRTAGLYTRFLDSIDVKLRPNQVSRLLERRDAASAIVMARSGGVIGRERQLRRMLDTVALRHGGHAWLPTVALTGPGGSGKSAMLAEFVHRLNTDRNLESLIVWLDFDYLGLSNGDPAIWMGEFARQLGLANDSLAVKADLFRAGLADLSLGMSDRKQHNFQRSVSEEKSLISLWRRCWDDVFRHHPVVLILDTLEEIAVQTDDVQERLERWLWSLVYEYAIRQLHIVYSGRVLPERLPMQTITQSTKIRLRDLPRWAAVELFTAQLERSQYTGPAVPVKKIVAQFGGNPLVVKLLANWVASDPEHAMRELGDAEFARAKSALYQGVIYTRILKRMRAEPAIQKLACPGLVLRRVTPDLIVKVLAEPCGLGEVSIGEANRLFGELRQQVWLVQRDRVGSALEHRKDLRQLMLRLMENEGSELARAIHSAAADYYASAQAVELPPARQLLEARYHRLMLGTLEELDRRDAEALLTSAGTDIECAPKEAVARLKAAADFRLELTEAALLDEKSLVAYRSRLEHRSYYATGEVPLPESKLYEISSGFPRNGVDYNDVIRAFVQADFAQVAEMSGPVFDRAFDERISGVRVIEGRNLTDSSLWVAALAVLAVGDPKTLANRIANRLSRPQQRSIFFERFNLESRSSVSFYDALSAILCLLDSDYEKSDILRTVRIPIEIQDQDMYRVAQLHPGARNEFFEHGREVRAGLLRFMTPSFLRYLELSEMSQRSETVRSVTMLAHRAQSSLQRIDDFNLPFNQRLAMQMVVIESDIPGMLDRRVFFPGVVPEIYAAFVPALAAIDTDVSCDFVDKLPRGLLALWPSELQGFRLRAAMNIDKRGWAVTLTEFADRYGILGPLLRHCANESKVPKFRHISKVLDTLEERFVAAALER